MEKVTADKGSDDNLPANVEWLLNAALVISFILPILLLVYLIFG